MNPTAVLDGIGELSSHKYLHEISCQLATRNCFLHRNVANPSCCQPDDTPHSPPLFAATKSSMAPNIQRFEHISVSEEDDRIRCAFLGCGMVRFVVHEIHLFFERTISKCNGTPTRSSSFFLFIYLCRWVKNIYPMSWAIREISALTIFVIHLGHR